jgi:ABC-2 type transport system permease protein
MKTTQASLLRTVLTFEMRVLRADAAFWLVLVLLATSVVFAVQTGARHWREHAGLVAAAQAEENTRLATLRKNLADVEAGRLAPPSPFRDPRSALWVGLTHGATQVALSPAPLAVAAVGLSDLHPPTVKVSARTKDEFLFADEIRNPLHLLAGAVDLAFVLVFVLPLALLALTYNLVSGERERGTLALTACTGADLRRVMAIKLAARAGVPTVATLAVAVLALARAGVPLASGALLALVLATLLYASFWAGLAAWVNSRGKSSEHNALALAAAWIGLVLVVPALVNTVADALYPTPSRAEMVLAVRGATVNADRERDASLARYREEHPQAQPDELRRGSAAERVARRLAVVDASAARAEAVVAAHDAQLARRQTLVDAVAFVSPALLMQLAVTDLAGTGSARYAAFYSQVDAFHAQWRAFFLSKARNNHNLTATDYAAFPRYATSTPSTAASTTAPRFVGLGLLAACAAAFAWRGLRRCERR